MTTRKADDDDFFPADRSRSSRPSRSRKPLIGAAVGVAVAAVAVAAAFVVMGGGDDGKAGGAAKQSDVLPTVYTPSMTDRDTARLGRRTADPRPLTEGEVFTPSHRTVTYRSHVLTLADSDVSADCMAVTWGARFQEDLRRHGCNQVVRGSYVSRDKRHVGQFVAINLADQAGAEQIIRDLNPAAETGFVRPLPAPGTGEFGRGFSAAYAQAYGHYAVMAWVQRTGGAQPANLNEMIDVSLAVEKPGDFVWARLQLLPSRRTG
ncbi:MAG TPA: hypothetical protein VHJ17_17910 [Thermomonospora sp.]|nr:hypothetical protein [Thermomonospora sp.]